MYAIRSYYASIFAAAGFAVQREYYVNDAGNQIDLLGVSLQLEGQHSILKEKVEWPESFYRGEYLSDFALEASYNFV